MKSVFPNFVDNVSFVCHGMELANGLTLFLGEATNV